MARIAGVDLPRNKRIEIGLTYIFGLGRTRAIETVKGTRVNPNTRVRDLTDEGPHIERELALIKPQAVVALGATAARTLAGRPVGIMRERGHWIKRADGLPVLITLHPSALLRGRPEERDAAFAQWLEDLQQRGSTRSVGVIQFMALNPTVDTQLENVDLRRAISMAVDRQAVIDAIFAGTRKPATGWVSPVVDGFKAGACGDWCTYDPERAKEMWDEAGGYDGELTLSYNGDGDHGPWTEAVCNQIRDNLDVECKATPTVDFATFLTDLEERKIRREKSWGIEGWAETVHKTVPLIQEMKSRILVPMPWSPVA